MGKEKARGANPTSISSKKSRAKSDAISYRLKGTKTANGLSHFIMYGDKASDQNPL